jgi:hypothetical protein
MVYRGARQNGAVLGVLVAAGIVGVFAGLAANWQPALRFGEAAAALGAAYAAFEILLAPAHGLPVYSAAIGGALLAPRLIYRLQSVEAQPGWFLLGNALAQLLLFAAFSLAAWRFADPLGWPRTRRVLAGAALACALVWFGLQL